MIVSRNISVVRTIKWSGHHFIWLLTFVSCIASLYYFKIITITIPWLPLSVIATAVAFYVGLKNNQAFERLWEARKIWGEIVNESRSWGMLVDGFITNFFNSENKLEKKQLQEIKQRLIYRHIAWLYAHRNQLLIPAPWEHISTNGYTKRTVAKFQKRYGIGLLDNEKSIEEPENFLLKDEYNQLKGSKNMATQILNLQSRDLTDLREKGVIEDFRHIELVSILKNFYACQGKNERIKKFPLPRQYANMSQYFIGIFIFLLPFSMVPELMKLGQIGFLLSIPITALIGWVYVMMEIIGDYSENPFQGMANDIPMLSLCRTIEIDLRQMLGETDLPPVIKSNEGILL